jgi:HD-GYP domain-containing protein (c-di-GMP phosphodiesterase class II)
MRHRPRHRPASPNGLDGRGFPDGLKADAIPLEVRVVTVADSFDAMTSLRSYRPAMTIEKAIEELQVWKGRQFDPAVVDALVAAFPNAASLPVATAEMRPLHLPPAEDVRSADAPT